MTKKKNKFEFKTEQEKLKYLQEIIGFFHTHRDEKIGQIAAQELLEFFTQTIGEEIYKKAVDDCRKVLGERYQDIDMELMLLGEK